MMKSLHLHGVQLKKRERPKSKRVRLEKKQVNEAEKLLNEASSEVVRKRRARRTADQPARTKRRKLSDAPLQSQQHGNVEW